MSYILESRDEGLRLQKQSQNPAYDFRRELAGLVVKKGARILDAGCGSGVVTRYLGTEYPHASVEGCDFSSHRIELARQLAADCANVNFTCANLGELPFAANSFDTVISRYVFQHLGEAGIEKALGEFQRILKPRGKLFLIDGDGLFINLFPQSAATEEGLKKIAASGMVDFSVGRKLPHRMQAAGFTDVD
jgi:SAM-dependent methyltransferase